MTGDKDWERLNHLFAAAAALRVGDRKAYLHRECADDSALLNRLCRLLELDDHGGILDSQSALLSPTNDDSEVIGTLLGRRIGAYHIIRVIGAGGMGIVYEALQENPPRPVALKVLHGSLLSRSAVHRFQREVEILGRLQHPAIAGIYEAGVFETDAGPQPFFAMELIDGRPLHQFAAESALSTRDRVVLLAEVCDGIAHAHAHGIIHRDLKPVNIFVYRENAKASIKILDFGIARIIDSDMHHTTLRTDTGQLMGTLAYMSPEQVSGDPARVTCQSDVYALGVIGYELLGGRLPHDLRNVPLHDALRIVQEAEPSQLGTINRMLRGDLDTIMAKAMEKQLQRRYRSAIELRADLQRYLNDEPVLARRPTTGYQLRKFARRNKALVGATLAVFVVMLLGLAGMGWQWSRAMDQRNRAMQAEREAKARAMQILETAMNAMGLADESLSDLPGGTRAWDAVTRKALDQLSGLPWEPDVGQSDFRSVPYLLAYAQHRVGEVALVKGRISEGLESFQKALAIRQQLVERCPSYETFVRTLGVGHWKVAEALIRLGRMKEAGQHLEIALGIYDRSMNQTLAGDSEAAGIYLGGAHRRIGELKLLMGDAIAAEPSFRSGLELVNAGLAREPRALNLRRGKATALRGLGETLLSAGKHQAAIETLEECSRIIQALREESTSPGLWDLSNQALTHLAMGKALAARGDHASGQHRIHCALQIGERLSGDDPDNLDSRLLDARCRAALGVLLDRSGEVAQAGRELDATVNDLESLSRLSPESIFVLQELISALVSLGAVHETNAAKFGIDAAGRTDRLMAAQACYRRGIELLDRLPNLGVSTASLSDIQHGLKDGMARIAEMRR